MRSQRNQFILVAGLASAVAALSAAGCTSGGSGNSNSAASGGPSASGGSLASGGSFANGGSALGNSGGSTGLTAGGVTSSAGGFAASSNPGTGLDSGSSVTASGGSAIAMGGAATGQDASNGTALPSIDACDDTSLIWKSGAKTNYISYPDPGSEECIMYNGCTWAGQFAACDGTKTEDWVSAHNIVSAFPDFDALQLHDLCLRKGDTKIVVTVLDTCGDSDCGGCCTQNKGNADELIDIESYTNDRWGVDDGPIEWADLGPTAGSGCD